MQKKIYIYIYWEYQAIFSGGTSYTTFVLNISPNTWKQFTDWYKSSPTYGTLKIFHKTQHRGDGHVTKVKNHSNQMGIENKTIQKSKNVTESSFCWFLLNISAVLHDNTRQSWEQLWHLLLGKAVFLEGSLLRKRLVTSWFNTDLKKKKVHMYNGINVAREWTGR